MFRSHTVEHSTLRPAWPVVSFTCSVAKKISFQQFHSTILCSIEACCDKWRSWSWIHYADKPKLRLYERLSSLTAAEAKVLPFPLRNGRCDVRGHCRLNYRRLPRGLVIDGTERLWRQCNSGTTSVRLLLFNFGKDEPWRTMDSAKYVRPFEVLNCIIPKDAGSFEKPSMPERL